MKLKLNLAIAAIALAAGLGVWVAQPTQTGFPGISAAMAQDSDVDTSMVVDMALGQEDAPITVIEYASFTCPHCANFHETVFDELRKNYIDTGKIRFIMREVYFDRFGLWAGMVARCSGDPAKYFGTADLVYSQQKQWTQGEPAAIADNLRRIGLTSGLSKEQLDACMSDSKMAEAMVAYYQKTAGEDEITGTPTFIIDGEKFSNMDYDDFAAALDEKLAE